MSEQLPFSIKNPERHFVQLNEVFPLQPLQELSHGKHPFKVEG
jgi:hypothetical protein